MFKLKSLKLSNFRSFMREQEIDFSKTNTTAIYGANASGKSNIARALDFMKWFILYSANAEISRIPFEPFLLYKDNESPTEIEIVFQNNSDTFRYEVSFSSSSVIHEKLVDLTSQKERVVFNREKQEITNSSTASKNGFTENLLNRTRETTLLITKAREDNNKYANILFDFLYNFKVISSGDPELRRVSVELLNSKPDIKNKVLDFLQNADLWIRDIEINEVDTPDEVIKGLPFTEEFKKNFQKSISITTSHSVRNNDGSIVDYATFSLDNHESAGTSIIFNLAAIIVDTLEHNSSLYIDEFGLHLHSDICRYILKKFKDKSSAQLIFNTHDASLMECLDRDDMIFVDKNSGEESLITSLARLSPRSSAPFEKHYRKGLYGGKPMIKDF